MRLFTQVASVYLLAAIARPAAAQAPAQDPGAYNNAIVAEQVDLLKKNLRYISKAAHSENDRKIENRRLEVVEQNKLALSRLQHLAAFKGNDEFRLAAIRAFKTTLDVYSADFKQVNTLASTRSDSYEAMQRFFDAQEAANKKLAVVSDSVDAAQQRFAKAQGFSLSTSRESAKLSAYAKAVDEVNHYQHEVFLPYFRLQKFTARLSDALNAQDAAAFEAARVAVGAEADKTAAELAALPGFRGKDMAYRNAARDYANMYVVLCANQFVQMAELMKNKDHLTKADVQTINGHIATFNQQRQKYNDAYNRTASAFMDTYVPVMND
ncbi:hypothetical protein MON38_09185 [Hymenobacter sp. DH14]|uniref:Uncharacterized protein n=1 Tax=Hymenobacter cyanobacteriorum TaxID=2926463 RepID=A0A9X1VG97_9BACT|nr:hypothetical protein [Hymenobacter cyanobacteriorum]MCI1187592.1 hypothetical protein [Hymenobacter cyanobacteriorum]